MDAPSGAEAPGGEDWSGGKAGAGRREKRNQVRGNGVYKVSPVKSGVPLPCRGVVTIDVPHESPRGCTTTC